MEEDDQELSKSNHKKRFLFNSFDHLDFNNIVFKKDESEENIQSPSSISSKQSEKSKLPQVTFK